MGKNYFVNREGYKYGQIYVLPTEVFQEYLSHPLVNRLYLTDVGFFPTAGNHYCERTVPIPEYIFIYCEEGSGTVVIAERVYTIHKNEAICIPAGTPHRYYADRRNPWSILWVHFKGEDTAFYPLENPHVIRFRSESIPIRMRFCFEGIFHALDDNYSLGNFIYIGQLLSLILSEAYQYQHNDPVQGQNRKLSDVIHYMTLHIDEMLSLEDLCACSGLSSSYLHTLFIRHTNHSPIEFFIQLKMKNACQLIISKDLPIYEIAHIMGYNDPYYFSRIFKKVVGVSPKEYKKNKISQQSSLPGTADEEEKD